MGRLIRYLAARAFGAECVYPELALASVLAAMEEQASE